MRRLALLLALLIAPSVLHAQTVTSGTVKDPNNLAYSSASLTISGAASLAIPLNSAGGFTISLTPGVYTFSAFFGGIAPPIGTGPQTCTATNITVSGGTFSVPFTCPALTNFSGGSAGNPAAPPCALQLSNTAVSGFITANLGGNYLETDSCTSPSTLLNPFTLFQEGTQWNAGPNPWVDTAPYMRWVLANFQAVANCATGTPSTVTFTSGAYANFKNNDGVVLYGCGATNILSTPAAPTVTPASLSSPDTEGGFASGPTGSTTYPYCIVARDKNGGLTACSTNAAGAGTTTTGLAALGLTTSTVSTLARSGDVVTATTSAANNATVGGIATITGSTDATFSGMFVVQSVTPPDIFTYKQGMSTTYGATASATGGTATVYNCNHLSWTPVLDSHGNPAWQYYIYAGAGGAFLGVTAPGANYWNDCGTISYGVTVPDFVPATAPAGATNDYLQTRIVAGAGTSSATIDSSTPVLNSITGTEAKFDTGFGWQKAITAAATNAAPLHVTIPPSGYYYVINSHVDAAGASIKLLGGGCMALNETMELDSVIWLGSQGGGCIESPQFSWGFTPTVIVQAAFPGFLFHNPAIVDHLGFTALPQGLIMTFTDGYTFNSSLTYDNFTITGTDYFGQAVLGLATANMNISFDLFSGNDTSGYGYSITPLVLFRNDPAGAAPSGGIYMESPFFVGRTFGYTNTPTPGGGATIRCRDCYAQANRMPLIVTGAQGLNTYEINNVIGDTSSQADFACWNCGGLSITLTNISNVSAETSGKPGILTGDPIRGVTLNYDPNAQFIGQNFDMLCPRTHNSIGDFVNNVCTQPGSYQGTTTLSGGTAAITFSQAYFFAPVCTANDQTAANAVQVTPSTTGLTLTGTGTDVIAWNCTGNPN